MHVRLAVPDDAAAIAAIYRPIVERTTISFELEAPSAAVMRDRIAQIEDRYPWVVAHDARVVGFAYAGGHRERGAYAASVDCSIYIDESARGNGVGRALYADLFSRLQVTGRFHRVFAGIALPNEASVALHRRFGFEPVGVYREVGFKFGRWIDVSWWQRGLSGTPWPRDKIAT